MIIPTPFESASVVSLPALTPELVTIAVLAVGVLATVVPFLPGGLVSLVGVWGYWLLVPDGVVGPPFLALASLLAGVALLADWVAGPVSAKAGGAGTLTAVLAGVVGVVGLLVAGPPGLLLGAAGTVFALELRRGATGAESARAAVATTVGLIAATGVQLLMTGTILLGFALLVLF